MDILLAWGVVFLAGLGALAGVFVQSRAIAHPLLRSLIRCLAAVWLLLPWSIQVEQGHYAPAFIVAIFEGAFRSDGSARAPLLALALATVFVLVVFLAVSLISRRAKDADPTT